MNPHIISEVVAREMIARYVANKEALLNGDFAGQDILPNSESFNREAIELLLANYKDYTGIRLHYGMDEENVVKQIITAMDEDGKDIYTLVVERGLIP